MLYRKDLEMEGFAKRQAKDNKLKEQEHRKLVPSIK